MRSVMIFYIFLHGYEHMGYWKFRGTFKTVEHDEDWLSAALFFGSVLLVFFVYRTCVERFKDRFYL